MARKVVEQVQCDRCGRVEMQLPRAAEAPPAYHLRLNDQELVYNDLCARCDGTLANLFKQAKEWDRELKQSLFEGPVLSANQAPPTSVAPDYSPPKPHSQASVTKR